jgi:hypothetical protein
MESGLNMLHPKGFMGMINQHSWMFLSSYEALRKKLIENAQIDTLLHLGPRTFPEIGGEVVQNASFTLENVKPHKKGAYIRLVDDVRSELKKTRTLEAIQNPNCGWFFNTDQLNFEKIPGSPISYWVNQICIDSFQLKPSLGSVYDLRQGMATSDNVQFLRFWQELAISKIKFNCKNRIEAKKDNYKWYPYNKGGEFRKWYGNNFFVVNWLNDGDGIKKVVALKYPYLNGNTDFVVKNQSYYFKEGLTWSSLSSGAISFRYSPAGYIFDAKGQMLFGENILDLLGYLNSSLANLFLQLLTPTLDYNLGYVSKVPFVQHFIKDIITGCINISKSDWDTHQTSWDFLQSELIRCKSNCGQNCADLDMLDDEEQEEILALKDLPTNSNLLEHCYKAYQSEWRRSFFQLHQNEEELNRQFIEIYGLQEELTPDVPLEEITILQQELERTALAKLNKKLKREPVTLKVLNYDEISLPFDAKEVMAQFISYSVGCMFGRYSVDKEGLILANQGETLQAYLDKLGKAEEELSFVPDDDNIIPVLSDEWFEDDIVVRFHAFLKAAFGSEHFKKNLEFIEDALGKDIRKYFNKDFYPDHIRRYKKRPIYWQFSSPKGAFNVLIYMHRYTPDTINLILNKYLRQFIEKLRNQAEQLEHLKIAGTVSEQSKAVKEKERLSRILLELQEYEREIIFPLATERIPIDLDDGVLVNYNKFGRALKEVTGLNDKKTKAKVRGFEWIDTSKIK